MADGAFPSLVSKDRAVNATSNPIYTSLVDAAGDQIVIDASGFLTVNVNGTVTVSGTVAISGTVAVTQSGTWNIATVTTVTTLTGITNDVNIADGGNSITVDGTVAATQSGTWNIGTVASITADVNIADGGNSITVDAVDLDIRDLTHVSDSVKVGDGTDLLAVNADGSINVVVQSATVLTGEVHDYDVGSAIASDTADNHDYTVTGAGTLSTFILKSVIVSGSGNVKFEIQTGPVAGLATVAVGFLTGRQGDTKQVFFDPPVEVPVTSTGTVRIIRTNRQGSATDLYSTIIGQEI